MEKLAAQVNQNKKNPASRKTRNLFCLVLLFYGKESNDTANRSSKVSHEQCPE
jgi:hypothetical protein